jgi:hypothetical protein
LRRLILLAGLPAILAAQASGTVKAQYDWGYASPDGTGKGILTVLLDPGTGRTIIELQGLGERLLFLEGNPKDGFHLLIPRREVDQRAASLANLSLPFLPRLGSPQGLYELLTKGEAPGVKVSRKDGNGPVKMRYDGKDENGKELTVWLSRTRWEKGN